MARQSPVLAPKRLFLQIVELQAFYYSIGALLISFALVVSGIKWSPDYIFSWRPVRPDTSLGWELGLLWLLTTFFSVLGMAIIVGRSKLALDFALTLHGIHLLVVWIYTGHFPRSWLWWAVQGVSSILLVVLGIWTTQWRELKRTFFEDYEMVDIEMSRREQSS